MANEKAGEEHAGEDKSTSASASASDASELRNRRGNESASGAVPSPKELNPHLGKGYKNVELKSSDVMFDDTKRESRWDGTFKFGSTPFHRRRETCVLLVHFSVMAFFCLLSVILVRTTGVLFYAFLLYCGWMMLFQSYHYKGSFPSKWFRSLLWWRWFRNYFPIRLHRTQELDAQDNYIFGYHPHGIISLGAFINFGTEATHFGEMFPGISNRLLTLRSNFHIPFYGLYLGLLGICDASKESIQNTMKKGPGYSVTLVLGGAKESLDARPGRATLFLKERKGFVKQALVCGASLVPCYSFGENDLYDQVDNPKGSKLRAVQERLQSKLGFALPFVKGRGVFSKGDAGFLPQRHPVDTVVGRPIKVPKVARGEITVKMLDEYHAAYVQELTDLYDAFKDRFEPMRKETITIT